jgi:hypothetical protein
MRLNAENLTYSVLSRNPANQGTQVLSIGNFECVALLTTKLHLFLAQRSHLIYSTFDEKK